MPRALIYVGLSAALHLAAVALLVARPVAPRRTPTPLQIAVVERPPPEAPPAPAPPPRSAPQPPQRVRTARRAPPPPSASMKAPEPTPDPEVSSGIAPESTAVGGSFAAPTGNTLYAEPPSRAPAPEEVKPYAAEKYAPAAALTELPRLTAQPDLRRYYPPEARRKEHEGSVVLRLWLDTSGAVTRVEIISNPGDGLGEAAVRAARELRFSPAKIRGEPVVTSVPFTLHFVLH